MTTESDTYTPILHVNEQYISAKDINAKMFVPQRSIDIWYQTDQ